MAWQMKGWRRERRIVGIFVGVFRKLHGGRESNLMGDLNARIENAVRDGVIGVFGINSLLRKICSYDINENHLVLFWHTTEIKIRPLRVRHSLYLLPHAQETVTPMFQNTTHLLGKVLSNKTRQVWTNLP